jgi:uroporphyrinogen-III synthase
MRILVTRPEPDNARTAAALRERGHAVVLAPLMRIEPLTPDLCGGPFAALVLTSANAVRALACHPQRGAVIGQPVFAGGGATAEVAGDAAVVADGRDTRALAGALASALAPGPDRDRLRSAGLRRAATFTWDAAARATARLYEQVAGAIA